MCHVRRGGHGISISRFLLLLDNLVKEKGNYLSETFGNGKVTSSSSISHPLQISKTANTSCFKRVTPKSYTYQATNNVNLKSQTCCRNI